MDDVSEAARPIIDELGVVVTPLFENSVPGLYCECERLDEETIQWNVKIKNYTCEDIIVHPFSLGDFDIKFRCGSGFVPKFIHALNARVTDAGPIALELEPNQITHLAARCPGVPHLEVAILVLGDGGEVVTFGPTTQHSTHAFYTIEWDGADLIRVRGRHVFLGIEGRTLKPNEELPDESWFIQVNKTDDYNVILNGYLDALEARIPNSNRVNPLRNQTFFATWNNSDYWLIDEKSIQADADIIKQKLPETDWLVIDDGYQRVSSKPPLPRGRSGKYLHSFEIEKNWFVQAPGVSFAFADGDGVDEEAFPDGLKSVANYVRSQGIRPGIWVGMEAGWYSSAVKKRQSWFLKSDFHDEEDPDLNRAIPDLSIAEVREEIEATFRYLFVDCGFEALKIDFVTLLTEHPDLVYRNQQKSGAEWRTWLFDTLRRYLPMDGFVTMACYLPMGAPFYSPWIDSVRHSFDQRDGEWSNIVQNVRWSVVPQLASRPTFPILDADSLSIYSNLDRRALTLWADYALTTGTLHEFSGDIARFSDEEIEFLKFYLNNKQNGAPVWYGEFSFLFSNGLPSVVYRDCPTGMIPNAVSSSNCMLICVCNWLDEPIQIDVEKWVPQLRTCRMFTEVRSNAQIHIEQLNGKELSSRSSLLLCAVFEE